MSKTPIEDSVVYAARSGDKSAMDYIVEEMASVVGMYASGYTDRCSYTRSDLIQEGMLGLLGAIYGFSSEGGASFRTYASTCILNAIRCAVRKQTSGNNSFLSSCGSLDDSNDATDFSTDPQALMSMQYSIAELNKLIETELTQLERDTLKLHIAGYSNRKTAEILSVREKSVDNALRRARKKLREKWIP